MLTSPPRAEIDGLIDHRGSPALSLSLPTTPRTPDAQADRIALKKLLRDGLARIAAAAAPMAFVFRSVGSHPRLAAPGLAGSADHSPDHVLADAARAVLDGLRAAAGRMPGGKKKPRPLGGAGAKDGPHKGCGTAGRKRRGIALTQITMARRPSRQRGLHVKVVQSAKNETKRPSCAVGSLRASREKAADPARNGAWRSPGGVRCGYCSSCRG
jgi:hypothetical protein